jgi:type II secretory pathway pseudopilin PulG
MFGGEDERRTMKPSKRFSFLAMGFTSLELMVVILIAAILAAVAMTSYQGYRDRAAMLVDETNQRILQAAVKLYAYDHNALPASLSQLRSSDLRRAYALVTLGKEPLTFLAHLREKVGLKSAFAHTGAPGPLHSDLYQNNGRILVCPGDRNGGVSYQINSAFAGASLATLLLPANGGSVLIFESDTAGNGADLSTRVSRHGGGTLSVETTVGGERRRYRHSNEGNTRARGGG